MARTGSGRAWGDRIFAASLGTVMAVTFAFFVMAIPAATFELFFSFTGLGGVMRISQWSVAILLSGASGLVVTMMFLPPRAPPLRALVPADTAPDDVTDRAMIEVIEEGILDLLDDLDAGAGTEDRLFIDLAAIREAAAARAAAPEALAAEVETRITPAARKLRRAAIG